MAEVNYEGIRTRAREGARGRRAPARRITASSSTATASRSRSTRASPIPPRRPPSGPRPRLVEQLRTQRADVVAALNRMEEGTYGKCENCGNAIPFERLEAVPRPGSASPASSGAEPRGPTPHVPSSWSSSTRSGSATRPMPPTSATRGRATLPHIAEAVGGISLPNMAALGLGSVADIAGVDAGAEPRGCLRIDDRTVARARTRRPGTGRSRA